MTNTRLSCNINDETQAAIRASADRHRTNVTETVRRMAVLLDFIEREQAAGGVLEIRRADGRVVEVTVL